MGSNLTDLGKQILTSYSVKPETIRVIQGGGIKTVWKISSAKGTYCLKRLRNPLEKVHFSIQAQNFLANNKANVPAIIPDRNGKLYVEKNGEVFVLYEWIPGNDLNFSKSKDLKSALEGLASFHKASVGFIPPVECRESTKWGKWPHHYESMLDRFKMWTSSKQSPDLEKVFRSHVDKMTEQGKTALQLLQKSHYPKWISSSEKAKGLCHQDYGEGNALLTKNGVVVLDLDGATYDLPLRDLRKIILKQMQTKGKWDHDRLHQILSWYTRINPLTSEQLRVLYIDCLFPHEFHNTAKNPFHKGKSISANELKRAAEFEKQKASHLSKLIHS